jgi:hypothetical protein
MADAVLYRQIVDVLLAENEKSTPPRPRDEQTAGHLAVAWGLYCEVHRLPCDAMLLAEGPRPRRARPGELRGRPGLAPGAQVTPGP